VASHHLAEERSLAYHCVTAWRIESEPQLLENARARVAQWHDVAPMSAEYVEAWRRLLDGPRPELLTLLVSRSEHARALGSIGELSPFHDTYGYHAQGVGPTTAVLPAGWEARLVVVRNENTRGASGLCLEVHDLLVSKLVAGRDKDVAFARVALAKGLASLETLRQRIGATALDAELRAAVLARVLVATRSS